MVLMFNGQEVPAAQGPGEVYSTEERRIGTWIDGKPLYAKTFTFSMTNPNSKNLVALDSEATPKMFDTYLTRTEGIILRAPNAEPNNLQHNISVSYQPSKNAIEIWCGSDFVNVLKNTPCWVIVRYTKTTDAPGMIPADSLNPGFHLYSTEERIVGYWIDGRPLYEKTFTGVGPSATSGWFKISENNEVENIDTVVDIRGMALPNNMYGWVPIPQTTSGQSVYMNIIYNPGIDSSRPKGLSVFSNSPQFLNKPLWVTMRYTKTTDQAARIAQGEEA